MHVLRREDWTRPSGNVGNHGGRETPRLSTSRCGGKKGEGVHWEEEGGRLLPFRKGVAAIDVGGVVLGGTGDTTYYQP